MVFLELFAKIMLQYIDQEIHNSHFCDSRVCSGADQGILVRGTNLPKKFDKQKKKKKKKDRRERQGDSVSVIH